MKRVLIVGAGALGSHVALMLRNEAELVVLDFDHVEQKNVLSQFHSRQSVGKNKAQALAGSLRMLFGLSTGQIAAKLGPDNLERVANTWTDANAPALVIDCTDNAEARRLCRQLAFTLNAPCLHAGLAAGGAYGMVRWGGDFVISEADAGVATCEDGAFLPFIVEVASRAAIAAQLYLRHGKTIGFAIAPDSVTRV